MSNVDTLIMYCVFHLPIISVTNKAIRIMMIKYPDKIQS